jgi:hypothetical protein
MSYVLSVFLMALSAALLFFLRKRGGDDCT